MVTKKTASYKEIEFQKKFENLLKICKESKKLDLNLWFNSMRKTSAMAFYFLSKDAVRYSKDDTLLRFFRIFFKEKYIYMVVCLRDIYLSIVMDQ